MRQQQAAFVHAIAVAAVGIAVGPVATTNAGAPLARPSATAATAAASTHDADGGGRTSTLLTTGWSFFRGDCRQRSACLSPNASVQHLGPGATAHAPHHWSPRLAF